MTTKCTGLIGRIFGHKWEKKFTYKFGLSYSNDHRYIDVCMACKRCGAEREFERSDIK